MKVEEAGIFEAKTRFSELVDRVEKKGVTYRITRRGKAVAELRPLGPVQRQRLPFGYGKGTVIHMADDFDAPLDAFREYM